MNHLSAASQIWKVHKTPTLLPVQRLQPLGHQLMHSQYSFNVMNVSLISNCIKSLNPILYIYLTWVIIAAPILWPPFMVVMSGVLKKKMSSFDWWSLSKQRSQETKWGVVVWHEEWTSLNRWVLERLSIVHQNGARQKHLSRPMPWFWFHVLSCHLQESTLPIHPSTSNLSISGLIKIAKDCLEQWNVCIFRAQPINRNSDELSYDMSIGHRQWHLHFNAHSPISPIPFRQAFSILSSCAVLS